MSIFDQLRAKKDAFNRPKANLSNLQVGSMSSSSGIGRPVNPRADADARTVTLPSSPDGESHITFTL